MLQIFPAHQKCGLKFNFCSALGCTYSFFSINYAPIFLSVQVGARAPPGYAYVYTDYTIHYIIIFLLSTTSLTSSVCRKTRLKFCGPYRPPDGAYYQHRPPTFCPITIADCLSFAAVNHRPSSSCRRNSCLE